MKIKTSLLFAVAVAASCMAGYAQTSTLAAGSDAASAAAAASEIMPLVAIADAALPDAIQTLARTANINIQLEPKVLSPVNAQNVAQPQPVVNLRWENVTAMQALYALLDNYNLQMTQDSKSGIYRVHQKEPNALPPLEPRVLTLKYSQPTNMIPFVKANFTNPQRSQVLADPRTGQLFVLATEKEHRDIEDMISRLDTSPSQVLIEARFIEATENPRTAKGVDWTGTLAAHNVTFGNRSSFVEGLEPTAPTATQPLFTGITSGVLTPTARAIADTSSGFGPVGFLNTEGLSAVVSFLNSDNQSETIATPRAVTLEGVPAELSVVQNVPVFEEEQGQTSGSGATPPATVKPNYNLVVRDTILNEVGTKLFVTPRIYGSSNVFLDLRPEISEVGPNATTTLGGRVSTAPTFLRKKIQTQALLPSGFTLVLGGLREDRNSKALTKVPLLGDIPLLGRAFRSDNKQRNKRQLIIFVTPTIIAAEDFLPAEESRDFLKQKPVEKPDGQWHPYDSAEPHDWTNPVK